MSMFTAKLFVAAFLMVFPLGNSQTIKSSLDCESIHEPDTRNYCRAISKKDKTYCSFIKNHDLRARCRAEVK